MSDQYEAVVNEKEDAEDYHLRQWTVDVKDGAPKSNVTFMYISAVTANLLLFSCTSCLGWSSPVIPSLESHDPLVNPLGRPVTPLETSWIASLLVLGASFSPLVTAKVGDLFGRKRALIVISLPHILSLLVLAFATDVWIYYVSRFVTGLVMGNVMGLLPVYLSEISEMRNRSTTGALISISLTSGILYSFVIGPLVSVRVLTLCCAAPAVLFLVVFGLFMPESPVHLVAQGDVRAASRVLRKLRRQTDQQVQQELRLIMRTIEKERQESQGNWTELFRDVGLRRSLVISLGLFVFMQLSGINPLTAFLEKIILAQGISISRYVSTNMVMVTQIVSSFLTITIVERFTKRVLLLVSSLGSSASLIALSIYLYLKFDTTYNVDFFFWFPIASIISFFLLINIGMMILPWGLTSEMFPTAFRSTAVSLASFTCFFISFVMTLGYPLVQQALGLTYCFLFSAGSLLLCALFIYCLVPETKGRTSAQIQEILRR